MYILGVNFLAHDSSACLIKDGQLIGAAEEEKFDRIKNSSSFPENSINFCLKKAKIKARDVDFIAFPCNRWLYFKNRLVKYPAKYYPRASGWFGYVAEEALQYLILPYYYLRKKGFRAKIYFIDHHSAHGASAFFVSPFKDCAVLTVDGMGESSCVEFFSGKNNRLSKLDEINFPHSIGAFYLSVSHFLGFSNLEGPGKVMGLAAYGSPSFYEDFKKIIKFTADGKYEVDVSYFNYPFWKKPLYSKKFVELFGKPRQKDSPISQRDKDIACSLQKITEEIVIHLANYLHKITHQDNICLAGGVALNGLANTKIIERTPFKKIFIQPAAGDAGLALGGAFYVYHQIKDRPRRFVMEHAYWGPSFNEQEIREALDKERLSYKFYPDIISITAELLAQGKVIGWFQGATEWGPRALGNRSILADPRRKEMKEIINIKIKERESFRPYAPSILEEENVSFFEYAGSSPFMLLVYNTRENKENQIPAVIHVDGTARVQTVKKITNPLYWSLIDKFKELTGIPVLLNTSFNRQEPIVCSPKDAIVCFLRSEVDCLVIGNYLVTSKEPKKISHHQEKIPVSLIILRKFTMVFRFILKIIYFLLFLPAFIVYRIINKY